MSEKVSIDRSLYDAILRREAELLEWRKEIANALGGGAFSQMPERCRVLVAASRDEPARAKEKRALREGLIRAALTGILAQTAGAGSQPFGHYAVMSPDATTERAIRQADAVIEALEGEAE